MEPGNKGIIQLDRVRGGQPTPYWPNALLRLGKEKKTRRINIASMAISFRKRETKKDGDAGTTARGEEEG